MSLFLWLELATPRRRLAAWLIAATVIAATVVILEQVLRTQSFALDSAVQHQVDGIRWVLNNLRGAFAPDSSSQPACRDILLRSLKRALRAMQCQL